MILKVPLLYSSKNFSWAEGGLNEFERKGNKIPFFKMRPALKPKPHLGKRVLCAQEQTESCLCKEDSPFSSLHPNWPALPTSSRQVPTLNLMLTHKPLHNSQGGLVSSACVFCCRGVSMGHLIGCRDQSWWEWHKMSHIFTSPCYHLVYLHPFL